MACDHLHVKTFYRLYRGLKMQENNRIFRCVGIDCPYGEWVRRDKPVLTKFDRLTDRVKG